MISLCVLTSELKLKLHKPVPPPKPKVILQRPVVDVSATEQLISQLRMENVELQKNLLEQQTTILGLRRDLAGASARLTDMAGEYSGHRTGCDLLPDGRTQIFTI